MQFKSIDRKSVLVAHLSKTMKITLETKIIQFPKRISLEEALDFYRNQAGKHDIIMVAAAGWRVNPEPGEENWFEELTADEFEDEDFLEDFAEADLQLWMR